MIHKYPAQIPGILQETEGVVLHRAKIAYGKH
jgi:hypothetical protein